MPGMVAPRALVFRPLVKGNEASGNEIVLSNQDEHISSSSSHHFVPKDQNKLRTHDKSKNHAELWVKMNVFNVFVMYALD